jgi:hypothetical protein
MCHLWKISDLKSVGEQKKNVSQSWTEIKVKILKSDSSKKEILNVFRSALLKIKLTMSSLFILAVKVHNEKKIQGTLTSSKNIP